MFRSRGQHEVRSGLENLNVERFIDLTPSKSHRSSTNLVITRMHSMEQVLCFEADKGISFKFIVRTVTKMDDYPGKWTLLGLIGWKKVTFIFMHVQFELDPSNSFYLSFKALIFITNNFTSTCIQISRCMYTLNDVGSVDCTRILSCRHPYHRLFKMRLG